MNASAAHLFTALLWLGDAPPVPPPATDEITVVATRGKCRVQLAGRMLSARELASQTGGWVGKPLRVVTPKGASNKCLARIAFKLGERGVNLLEFVEAPERP